MNTEVIERWIEAGKNIAINPSVNVLCPVCQKVFLQILDIKFDTETPQFERHMICNECGAYNALRL
ncbi:hypothetical protein [Limnobaculum xujianqingii]|uniref:hypothetical protein n=1 Tax=Limnobaculum xujianqingii TaxID=2738837 RepID=UPI00112C6503|nr:hypothetical protein [Limnobaculum xujianqingii]